jgi:hypothetical protein
LIPKSLSENSGEAQMSPFAYLKATVVVMSAAMIFPSCNKAEENRIRITEEYKKRLPAMEQSGVVAGPGEKTFEEKYGLKISLPMPENQFVALLDRLKLRYHIAGQRPGIIPVPFHCRPVDLSRMQKAYQIYGKQFDSVRVLGEAYHAYVNEDGSVVCLENRFVYEGP